LWAGLLLNNQHKWLILPLRREAELQYIVQLFLLVVLAGVVSSLGLLMSGLTASYFIR
jgi:hypothetical protein